MKLSKENTLTYTVGPMYCKKDIVGGGISSSNLELKELAISSGCLWATLLWVTSLIFRLIMLIFLNLFIRLQVFSLLLKK